MKHRANKIFIIAVGVLVIPFLFVSSAHAQFSSGCELVTSNLLGNFFGGDYVPVCEVNPRIISPTGPIGTTAAIVGAAGEGVSAVGNEFSGDAFSTLTGIITGLVTGQGLSDFVSGDIFGEGSILQNTTNKNIFDLLELTIFRVLLTQFKLFVMDQLVDQVISAVTGNGESPQFIQNWEQFLAGAYNLGALSAGRDILEAELCESFGGALKSYWGESSALPFNDASRFARDMNCSLDPLLEELGGSRELYQEDFRNGGWIAYQEELFNPKNTYYGALFASLAEAEERAAAKESAAGKEGVAGKGYLPVKKCLFPPGASPEECIHYEITTPASVFESAVDAATRGRFDFVVNADQIIDVVIILLESFINDLIESGTDGLIGLFDN